MNGNDVENLVVVKRSGQRVNFNGCKIAVAIKQAFDSVIVKDNASDVNIIYSDTLNYIRETYKDRKTINVEDIQDIIEQTLKNRKYTLVYNAFSEYRRKRASSRKVYEIKQEHKLVKAIEKIANDNAIKNSKTLNPIDTLLEFGRTISTEVNKAYVLDSKFVRAHEEGNIYIHNLDNSYLGIFDRTNLKYNLEDKYGLDSFTYVKDEVNAEISLSRIDFILDEILLDRFKTEYKNKITNYLNLTGFIDYIKLNKVYDVIDRQDSIDLNLDLFDNTIANDIIKNIFVSAYNDTYDDVSDFAKEYINKLLLKLNNNLKRNKKYSISLGTNDSLLGKIVIDNFIINIENMDYLENVNIIFKLNSDATNEFKFSLASLFNKNISISYIDANYNKGNNEVEYFGDGTRIFENINDEIKDSVGRMVISKTSINLYRLSLNNKDINKFMSELDKTLELVKNELLLQFETIGDKYKENYNILFRGNIYDDEKLEDNHRIRKVIKNGALNVGLVGLKECVVELDSNNTYNLTIKILKHIREYLLDAETNNHINFILSETINCEATRKLNNLDKAIYGNIIKDKEYGSITDLFIDDYKKLGKIMELFNGGLSLEFQLARNTSHKKIVEIINNAINNDIGFFKIKLGRGGIV